MQRSCTCITTQNIERLREVERISDSDKGVATEDKSETETILEEDIAGGETKEFVSTVNE